MFVSPIEDAFNTPPVIVKFVPAKSVIVIPLTFIPVLNVDNPVKKEVDVEKKVEQFFNEYYAEFPLSKNEVRESRKLTKKTLERRRRKAQTMQIANYGTRDR